MRSFITRIRFPEGSQADQSSLHAALLSSPGLSVEFKSQRLSGAGLELEYRTSGDQSISELGRAISGAVDSVKRPSSFFIIREKKQ